MVRKGICPDFPCLPTFRIGTSAHFIVDQHSMWNMCRAFDGATGQPTECVEMESWPRMERLVESFSTHVRRALVEAFYPTRTTEGIQVLAIGCTRRCRGILASLRLLVL